MFEEMTVNATQMLVQLFWLSLIIIFVAGLAWTRMERNKHD